MNIRKRCITFLFSVLLLSSSSAFANTIYIDFESLPGPDGILGTADDIATPNQFLNDLANLYSSVGVNFSQGSLLQADFFDGNPLNHFISSTSPIGSFSVPVFGISIKSKSYWNAILTGYDEYGNVLAQDILLNPNAGISPLAGDLSISSSQRFYSFSILPEVSRYILNLDNLTLNTSPIPEPTTLALIGIGFFIFGLNYARKLRKVK